MIRGPKAHPERQGAAAGIGGWLDAVDSATFGLSTLGPPSAPIYMLYGTEGQIRADHSTFNPGWSAGLAAANGRNRPQEVLEFGMRAAIPAHPGMVRGSKADACTAWWKFINGIVVDRHARHGRL
jgi:hypothetical protein